MASPADQRLDSPSAQRNKDPIWGILESKILTSNSSAGEEGKVLRVLEVAAGVGVHSHSFCQKLLSEKNNKGDRKFESVQWYSTDPNPDSRRSIEAYRPDVSEFLQPALPLTLNEDGIVEEESAAALGPPGSFDLILCVNMIHISPWEATKGLMKAAKHLLKPGSGILYCYGPYREGGKAVESNLNFEEWLKEIDPSFGLRNLEDVLALAEEADLELVERIEMPANNLSVLYRRKLAQGGRNN